MALLQNQKVKLANFIPFLCNLDFSNHGPKAKKVIFGHMKPFVNSKEIFANFDLIEIFPFFFAILDLSFIYLFDFMMAEV